MNLQLKGYFKNLLDHVDQLISKFKFGNGWNTDPDSYRDGFNGFTLIEFNTIFRNQFHPFHPHTISLDNDFSN